MLKCAIYATPLLRRAQNAGNVSVENESLVEKCLAAGEEGGEQRGRRGTFRDQTTDITTQREIQGPFIYPITFQRLFLV